MNCFIAEQGETATGDGKIEIEALRIKISDRSYADSSGKLRFDIRQGDTSCSTIRETFVKPRKNTEYEESRSSHKFGSCYSALFDPNDAIEFRIISDSGDDAYIDSAAVKLGGVWREWNGYQIKVNKHGAGNAWRLVYNSGNHSYDNCRPYLLPILRGIGCLNLDTNEKKSNQTSHQVSSLKLQFTVQSCKYRINGVEGACNLDLLHFTVGSAHNVGSGAYGFMRKRLKSHSTGVLNCFARNQEISITSMLEDYGLINLNDCLEIMIIYSKTFRCDISKFKSKDFIKYDQLGIMIYRDQTPGL